MHLGFTSKLLGLMKTSLRIKIGDTDFDIEKELNISLVKKHQEFESLFHGEINFLKALYDISIINDKIS